MRAALRSIAVVLVLSAPAHAAVFTFDTDPFAGPAGEAALSTPGRQIVGGEPSITFDPATDQFVFGQDAFFPYGFGPTINFANDIVENLPTSGVNVIVLRTILDPMAAGIAANLIAEQITTDGAGFFIYFNTGLNLPRLVFSTNLNDNTADLKIIARMTNLTGDAGRTALANFTEDNFRVPEPATTLLMMSGLALALGRARRRR